MKNRYEVCRIVSGAVSIFIILILTNVWVLAENITVIPLFSASGEATSSQVLKGQTFSSFTGKGLVGSLEITPALQKYTDGQYGLVFNFIPAGSFMMGSPGDESGRGTDETQHQVTLTESFLMQVTEVTQKQWKQVVQDGISQSITGADALEEEPVVAAGGSYNAENPVASVSWHAVTAWISILNQLTGRTFVLPTEARWEYVARAGTTTAWAYAYNYDDSDDGKATGSDFNPNIADIGWYVWQTSTASTVAYGMDTKPVAKKQANGWGVYDMHGNVAEWCADWYGAYPSMSVIDPAGAEGGSQRVVRGGHYTADAELTRSAARASETPDTEQTTIGFRLVLSPGN